MAVRFDFEGTADDGQVSGVLFRIVGIDGFDQTTGHIVSLELTQHAQRWRPYRAIAFETNSEEYPCEGMSFPGGSNLRYEKDMELIQQVCSRKSC